MKIRLLHTGTRRSIYTLNTCLVYLFLITMALFVSCRSSKKTVIAPAAKVQIAELDKGWLRYQLYLQPSAPHQRFRDRSQVMDFSIRVINLENNTSPLRRLCSGIEEYNTNYEYLLNRVKEDLYLTNGTEILYPVSYSFENNYNAFPFETINVGYKRQQPKKKKEHLDLVFIDQVFAHDTLVFTLNPVK